MKITKQARREAKELFRSCLVSGLLDANRVRLAVRSVLEHKPRGYLAVLGHFQRLLKLDLDRRSALVESAIPLTPALQAGVQARVSKLHGAGLNFSFLQNPALVGGVRVRVGSDVYDGSIRGRLEALQQSF